MKYFVKHFANYEILCQFKLISSSNILTPVIHPMIATVKSFFHLLVLIVLFVYYMFIVYSLAWGKNTNYS